jgi:hypothetical protein
MWFLSEGLLYHKGKNKATVFPHKCLVEVVPMVERGREEAEMGIDNLKFELV